MKMLRRDFLLRQRMERLSTIPGAGPVVALEVGEVERFSSVKKVISYCGLCSAEISSAGQQQRSPISKQRNKHLQSVLVEATHLAPRYHPDLVLVSEREKQRGNRNRATLAVARKLVAYLFAVAADEGPTGKKGRAPTIPAPRAAWRSTEVTYQAARTRGLPASPVMDWAKRAHSLRLPRVLF